MKIRITGLALAGLMAASLVLPAFAASSEEVPSSEIYLNG